MDCGQNPHFLLYNRLLISKLHLLDSTNEGIYFSLKSATSESVRLIHKVEIVGLLTQLYRSPDENFICLTVHDCSGSIQCSCPQYLISSLERDICGEIPPRLTRLLKSASLPKLRIGHMVRIRGILALESIASTTKKIKIQEIALENDVNAIQSWIREIRYDEEVVTWQQNTVEDPDGLSEQKRKEQLKQLLLKISSLVSYKENFMFTLANIKVVIRELMDETLLQYVEQDWKELEKYALEQGFIIPWQKAHIFTLSCQNLKKHILSLTAAVAQTDEYIFKRCDAFAITANAVKHILSHMEEESEVFSFINHGGQIVYQAT